MGLFNRKRKDGVRGSAQVVSCTRQNRPAAYQTCRLNLVVQVEGIPAYSIEHTQICPTKKWPHPGMVVPVVVSRTDPAKLRIDFDAMPDAADIARQRAEQQAAALRTGGSHLGQLSGTPQVNIVGGSAADIPPELRANLEQMLGVDLDGDGRIGDGRIGDGRIGDGDAGGDRIERLERLAQLHASGALTTDEFEAEKRRLLSS